MLKCGTVYFNLDCSTDEMYAKIYIILDPNFDVKNVGSPAVRGPGVTRAPVALASHWGQVAGEFRSFPEFTRQ